MNIPAPANGQCVCASRFNTKPILVSISISIYLYTYIYIYTTSETKESDYCIAFLLIEINDKNSSFCMKSQQQLLYVIDVLLTTSYTNVGQMIADWPRSTLFFLKSSIASRVKSGNSVNTASMPKQP